ncbi:MAG TPA: prepilin-type N-terminal cleavage/methylation domain-containing protein [Burkholderiaceae bacterium]|nr:prepilin-type N-terminal cleavage/methylation domain-containing protein [Burkholderiaceae bacterium]
MTTLNEHSLQSSRAASEAGFTLLEVLAVVAVLAILGTIGWTYFSTDRTRATALVARANDVAKALVQFKQDISCYPVTLSALYDRTQAQNTRCGIDGRAAWREPYLPRAQFTASGNLSVADIVPGAEMTIVNQAGGPGQQWLLRVTGLPADLLTRIAETCNGAVNAVGRCNVAPAGSGAGGSFDLLFDETT